MNRAVVFVSDSGFLFPTLVAASQVVAQVRSPHLADVFVILMEVSIEEQAVVNRLAAPLGITVVSAPAIALTEAVRFNRTHVPPTTLGRLFLCDYVQEKYEHILYLDGDIRIAGDITPLVRHNVKLGYIAAANDKLWISSFRLAGKHRRYLQNLGLDDPQKYFNAGVLAFRRATWEEWAPKVLAYFYENSEYCKFHDQSALNHIFRDRREILSPIYNFITPYKMAGDLHIKPRIVHYTGGLKPWAYDGVPWSQADRQIYTDFLRAHPYVASLMLRKSPAEQASMAAFYRRQHFVLCNLLPFLPLLRRARMRRYLKQSNFAVD